MVPGPDSPAVELVDVADDDSDSDAVDGDSDAYEEVIDGDGDSSDNEEVVDNSDVEVVGRIDAEPPSVMTVMQPIAERLSMVASLIRSRLLALLQAAAGLLDFVMSTGVLSRPPWFAA